MVAVWECAFDGMLPQVVVADGVSVGVGLVLAVSPFAVVINLLPCLLNGVWNPLLGPWRERVVDGSGGYNVVVDVH